MSLLHSLISFTPVKNICLCINEINIVLFRPTLDPRLCDNIFNMKFYTVEVKFMIGHIVAWRGWLNHQYVHVYMLYIIYKNVVHLCTYAHPS